jgi:hypothetical protein
VVGCRRTIGEAQASNHIKQASKSDHGDNRKKLFFSAEALDGLREARALPERQWPSQRLRRHGSKGGQEEQQRQQQQQQQRREEEEEVEEEGSTIATATLLVKIWILISIACRPRPTYSPFGGLRAHGGQRLPNS